MTVQRTIAELRSFASLVSTGPFGSVLHKSDYVDDGVPLINPINIVGDRIEPDPTKLVSEATRERLSSYILQVGDLVVGRRGDIGRCAVIGSKESGWICGTGCFFIRPLPSVDPHFLAHLIRSDSYRKRLANAAHGVTMPNLSNSALATLLVSIPPLQEQRRIVDILDRAASIRRLRQQAQETARQIVPALFNRMFGDPATNPMGWPVRPLGEVIAGFEGGRSMRPDGESKGRERYRVLKLSAVTSGIFRSEEAKPVPEAYEPDLRHIVRHGDLLITRSNTAELVGACCLVDAPPTNLLMPDLIWRVVWKDISPVLPAYVLAVLQHPSTRPQISALATGTSDSMRKLSQGRLVTLQLPVPPLSVQQGFSARATALDNVLRAQAASKVREDTIMESLQARLFDTAGRENAGIGAQDAVNSTCECAALAVQAVGPG